MTYPQGLGKLLLNQMKIMLLANERGDVCIIGNKQYWIHFYFRNNDTEFRGKSDLAKTTWLGGVRF